MDAPLMGLPPVLFVLPQTGAAADGGIASASEIIVRLRRHRPIIVTDRHGPRVAEWREAGIETHVIPQAVSKGLLRNPWATLRDYWRYTRELRQLIASSGAKVIHANSPLALQLSVGAAKSSGTKLVLNLRGTSAADRRAGRVKYWLLFAAADHILYLSHDMARRWREHASNATSSYSVTYSAVDPARFQPTPINSEAESIVLVLGLIRPLKGQLEFLRHVAPKLAENGVKVWFAGDSEAGQETYMRECQESAHRLGDAVQFLGYRTDIPELIARASVIAIPSRHEGLVRAMIEAMGCGRPVVSFDVCSAREILEDEAGGAGVVVQRGDYESLAQAILHFCRNREAADLAGERGLATARRLFAPEVVVDRYEQVYEDLGSS